MGQSRYYLVIPTKIIFRLIGAFLGIGPCTQTVSILRYALRTHPKLQIYLFIISSSPSRASIHCTSSHCLIGQLINQSLPRVKPANSRTLYFANQLGFPHYLTTSPFYVYNVPYSDWLEKPRVMTHSFLVKIKYLGQERRRSAPTRLNWYRHDLRLVGPTNCSLWVLHSVAWPLNVCDVEACGRRPHVGQNTAFLIRKGKVRVPIGPQSPQCFIR